MNKIREILQENPVVAAPMAGVSDRPSRLIAREYGCGLGRKKKRFPPH